VGAVRPGLGPGAGGRRWSRGGLRCRVMGRPPRPCSAAAPPPCGAAIGRPGPRRPPVSVPRGRETRPTLSGASGGGGDRIR
jgi:hypothetical protein